MPSDTWLVYTSYFCEISMSDSGRVSNDAEQSQVESSFVSDSGQGTSTDSPDAKSV